MKNRDLTAASSKPVPHLPCPEGAGQCHCVFCSPLTLNRILINIIGILFLSDFPSVGFFHLDSFICLQYFVLQRLGVDRPIESKKPEKA